MLIISRGIIGTAEDKLFPGLGVLLHALDFVVASRWLNSFGFVDGVFGQSLFLDHFELLIESRVL